MHYVYVLRSKKNGKYYTGETADLERQLKEHCVERTKSLRGYGPFDIVYFETLANKSQARKREAFLKTGQGRVVKTALIENFPPDRLKAWQIYLGS